MVHVCGRTIGHRPSFSTTKAKHTLFSSMRHCATQRGKTDDDQLASTQSQYYVVCPLQVHSSPAATQHEPMGSAASRSSRQPSDAPHSCLPRMSSSTSRPRAGTKAPSSALQVHGQLPKTRVAGLQALRQLEAAAAPTVDRRQQPGPSPPYASSAPGTRGRRTGPGCRAPASQSACGGIPPSRCARRH